MPRAISPAYATRKQAQSVVSAAGIDAAVDSTSLLGRGVKSLVTRIDLADGSALALKAFIRGGSTTREHRAYELLGEHELPLPQMLLGVASNDDFPFGFTLLTMAPGEPLNDHFVDLPREQLLSIYRGVGEFQRLIHRTNAPGFSDLTDHELNADNGALVAKRVQAALGTFLTHGGKPRLAAKLENFFAENDRHLALVPNPVLCHGDLHPENIRVAHVGGEFTFVFAIDLEEAFAGDPLMDLTRTLQSCPLPGSDLTAALLDGYGGKPEGFDDLHDVYFLLYELELWNYYAVGGSRKPLRSISRRIRRRLRGIGSQA
ncbi:MAG: aminoglycoside phosphotransferase family protein [Solirubrobacterales bacterium]|nr:aminoglycoside phosphotransferase family protein [Solirubrobacterales bacterium]